MVGVAAVRKEVEGFDQVQFNLEVTFSIKNLATLPSSLTDQSTWGPQICQPWGRGAGQANREISSQHSVKGIGREVLVNIW